MMTYKNLLLIVHAAVLLLLLSGGVQAREITVIELKGRPAEEIIPLIRPLLAPGDALSGTGYQLILRTDPKTLREVRDLISQLDYAPRNLLVSVRRGAPSSSDETAVGVTGSVQGDKVRISSGERNQQGVDVHLERRMSTARDDAQQQLRVLEGQRAFINTGSAVPYPSNRVVVTPGGAAVDEGVQFRNLRSGFYVLPRVSGERVTLNIEPVNEQLQSDHSIAVQQAQTVVSGRLGEWIALGGISEREQRSGRGILSTRSSQRESELGFYVKVELVK